MMNLPFLRGRFNDLMAEPLPRAGIIGGVFLVVVALAGLYFGGPRPLPAGAGGAEAWKLAAWSQVDPSSHAATLNRRNPWGQAPAQAAGATGAVGGSADAAAVAAAAAAAAAQKLLGIVTERGEDFVVMAGTPGPGRSPATYLRPGDSLADGSKIVSIDATDVTLDKDGTQKTLHLFRLNEIKK